MIKLKIKLVTKDLDTEQVDYLLIGLKEDLDNFVQDISLPIKDPFSYKSGQKGDPVTLGTLLIALSPIMLKSLLDFIQSWVKKDNQITIEAPNGGKIHFTGDKKYTEDEMIEIMKQINEI